MIWRATGRSPAASCAAGRLRCCRAGASLWRTANVRSKQARGVSSHARVVRRRNRPVGWYPIWTLSRISVRGCCDPSAATRSDWKMRILVFGGTGFVGLNIAAVLLSRGHAVTLFDRAGLPPDARKEFALHGDRLTAIQGDVTDSQAVEGVIAAGYGAIIL